MQEHDFEIIHIPGKRIQLLDFLSRIPCDEGTGVDILLDGERMFFPSKDNNVPEEGNGVKTFGLLMAEVLYEYHLVEILANSTLNPNSTPNLMKLLMMSVKEISSAQKASDSIRRFIARVESAR